MAWQSLSLPKSSLPKHAKIQGDRIAPATSDTRGKLHTLTFAQLSRLDGYHATVHWSLGSKKTKPSFTFYYSASIFADANGSSAAYGDAAQSLWEAGQPVHVTGVSATAFTVPEAGGRQDTFLALYRGPVELEFDLQLGRRTKANMRQYVLWQAGRIMAAMTARVQSLVGGLPATTGVPQPAPVPPLFVSPWGTGPVVKSPSLMVLDPSAPASTSFDPGTFRLPPRPGITSLAARHAILLPPPGLSRYARTLVPDSGGLVYDATAIYASARAADAAWSVLVHADDGQTWLQPLNLGTPPASLIHLPLMEEYRGWQTANESILAIRRQNVVMVLAETGRDKDALLLLTDRALATVPSWLHTQGTSIVDAAGSSVKLISLNWYGFEQQDFVAGGLDYRPYQDILQSIKLLGYNSIRLPFSNQLVEQNPVVTDHLQANPELKGMHALDIMDRIINQAGALGLSVILDDHRSEAGWSAEQNGLWYTTAYPDALWLTDWVTMARRYGVNNVVVGADLRNEPHAAATWGDGNPATDWQAAAQRAGNAVLAVNPGLLIVVEGVQFDAGSNSYWWGGNLLGVATAPVILHFPDGNSAHGQLVYSAHDYGKDNCANGCPWFNASTSYTTLSQTWDRFWGYIAEDPSKPYAAPIWVGEFGTCNYNPQCVSDTAPGSQGQWFSSLVYYLTQHNFSWAYWAVNGTQSTAPTRTYGNEDWYGLFTKDWSTPIPLLDTALHDLQENEPIGPPG